MIPARNHRVRQVLENRAAIVVDETRLPMEDASRGAHLGAVGGPNPLVAQAHAECRRRRAQFAEDVRTHTKVPRIRGMAGTGREDDRVGCERSNLFQCHFIVSMNDWFGPELANRLIQVVDERIIVVEDEDLHTSAETDSLGENPGPPLSVAVGIYSGSRLFTLGGPTFSE